MTDTTMCAHTEAVPVEVRDHTTGGTTVVARVCLTCHARLPVAWGCTACEWQTITDRRLGSPVPERTVILTDPCPAHVETM